MRMLKINTSGRFVLLNNSTQVLLNIRSMKNLLNRANCAGGSSLSNRNIHLTFHICLISRKTNSVSSFTFVWKWIKREREGGENSCIQTKY